MNSRGRPGGPKPAETLEERYADDSQLLRLYKRKLLKPGWAGKKDAVEKEYIRRMKARRTMADQAA